MLPSKIFMDELLNEFEPMRHMEKMLKCDIYEEENNYIVEVDIPGVKKEEIEVECESGYVNIKVEKKEEKEEKKYLHRERKLYQKYERSIYLGNIDEDQMKANYENGILKMIVPKEKENQSRKRIPIN